MGVYTEAVQKLYVAYFSRPADFGGLDYWEKVVVAANGDTSAVSAAFAASQEYRDTYAGKSSFQVINTIYQNLFGRDAEPAALLFWGGALDSNAVTIDNAVTTIAAAARSTDATAYASKVAAATAFTAALDTTPEILGYSGAAANGAAREWLAGVSDDGSLAAATDPATLNVAIATIIGASAGSNNGQTFQFTPGLDALVGTAANDLFIGSVASDGNPDLNTLSSLDSVNGGGGIDTLRILTDGAGFQLPTLNGVEIVEAQSTRQLAIDTSKAEGVTNLNVTRANGAVEATAAGSTDISVALANPLRAQYVSVNGGKDVAINLTGVSTGIDVFVGAAQSGNSAPVAAKGAVAVNVSGQAYAAGQGFFMGEILVNGGATVSVAQKAALNTGAANTVIAAGTVEQGSVTVIGDASTGAVNVRQDAAIEAAGAAYTTGGVTETASVTFSALAANQTLSLGGLTLTARTEMTAAEVATAFANLIDGSLPVAGDTQGSGLASKAAYTGALGGWTSGAAEGDTVVFTSIAVNSQVQNLAASGTGAAAVTTTDGRAHDGGASGGVMGVVAGAVHVADAANTIRTVTIDGYSTTGSRLDGQAPGSPATPGIGGASLAALTLSNGGDFTTGASSNLVLNLQNVRQAAAREATASSAAEAAQAATIAITAGAATLDVRSTSANAADLDSGATTALNVSGAGMLTATGSTLGALKSITVTGSAGLDLGATALDSVEAVDTTGTSGSVSVAIRGDKAAYTGGGGADNVTIVAASAGVTSPISLGAGDDRLDLGALDAARLGAIAQTVTLSGGEGADTLALSAAAASSLSGSAAFGERIDGFERLEIGQLAGDAVVNLANLDNIDYVIANGSGSANPPAALTPVVTVDGAAGITESTILTFGQMAPGRWLQVGGVRVTNTGPNTASAADVATAFTGNTNFGDLELSTGSLTGWTAGVADGNRVVYTSTTPNANVADLRLTFTSNGTPAPSVETTNGSAPVTEFSVVEFRELTAGQSYTIAGRTVTAAAAANAEAVAAAFISGNSLGNLTVTGSLSGWQVDANGDASATDARFTSLAEGTNVSNLSIQGAGASASATLTLNDMLSNATVRLNAQGAVEVNLADASGAADVVNLVAAASTGVDIGNVTVNKVETINITAVNTDASTSVAVSNNTLVVAADTAKTINVTGAGNLTLDLDSTTNVVTLVDGATATGDLTLSSSSSPQALAVTLRGGQGNDTLVANGAKTDILLGGTGNDTLVAGTGLATLSGGEGNDLFRIEVASDTVNSYAKIIDFTASDLLQFREFKTVPTSDGIGSVTVPVYATTFVDTQVTLADTAVFQDYANAVVAAVNAGEIGWFQFQGNTYVVADMGDDSIDGFVDGQDHVVQLTGLFDLSKASFNADFGTIGLV